jgi:hypothetical protein
MCTETRDQGRILNHKDCTGAFCGLFMRSLYNAGMQHRKQALEPVATRQQKFKHCECESYDILSLIASAEGELKGATGLMLHSGLPKLRIKGIFIS